MTQCYLIKAKSNFSCSYDQHSDKYSLDFGCKMGRSFYQALYSYFQIFFAEGATEEKNENSEVDIQVSNSLSIVIILLFSNLVMK